MTKDKTKANEEVIVKNGVKATLFDDVQKLILRHYDELFPNYEWMDYMESLDLMAAEVKVLRSELLDALRLATSLREVANTGRTSYRTDAEWDVWKKLCARLEALLLEIRGRWYAATLPAALGLTDSAEGPIRCGTFSEKDETDAERNSFAELCSALERQAEENERSSIGDAPEGSGEKPSCQPQPDIAGNPQSLQQKESDVIAATGEAHAS